MLPKEHRRLLNKIEKLFHDSIPGLDEPMLATSIHAIVKLMDGLRHEQLAPKESARFAQMLIKLNAEKAGLTLPETTALRKSGNRVA